MLQTAANSPRIMPIVKGEWESSTRSYETREDAARALIFDLSFYADYRFSQVRRLFQQTAMRDVLTKTGDRRHRRGGLRPAEWTELSNVRIMVREAVSQGGVCGAS